MVRRMARNKVNKLFLSLRKSNRSLKTVKIQRSFRPQYHLEEICNATMIQMQHLSPKVYHLQQTHSNKDGTRNLHLSDARTVKLNST